MDAIPPSLPDLHSHCEEKLWSNEDGRCSRHQWGQHQRNSSTSNGMWRFSRHTVINFSSATAFEAGEGGRPAGLQLKASNNKPGLSETKGRRGKGTWNEKQQKSFVYYRWAKSSKQSHCGVAVDEKICWREVTNISPAMEKIIAQQQLWTLYALK